MVFWNKSKSVMPTAESALPGRKETMPVPDAHFVSGHPLQPPWPEGTATVQLGMGCFWGAERRLWQLPGVHVTAVGYSGGFTPNPTYQELCSGQTGHAEVVLVVYRPAEIPLQKLLEVFFESHDPTQGMRQGNDVGTQYRSVIYVDGEQPQSVAREVLSAYQQRLHEAGLDSITTEIGPMPPFYYAEPEHQQYLAKNPDGYCGLGGTGVCF